MEPEMEKSAEFCDAVIKNQTEIQYLVCFFATNILLFFDSKGGLSDSFVGHFNGLGGLSDSCVGHFNGIRGLSDSCTGHSSFYWSHIILFVPKIKDLFGH